MKNEFNSVRMQRPNRNTFDLSHENRTTCGFGALVPIMVMETLPGDKFSLGTKQLIRFQPLVSPAMNRFRGYVHYWFVPNRILNPDWNDWIASKQGAPAFPVLDVIPSGDDMNYTSLMDYMGVPRPSVGSQYGGVETINAYPFAAYQAIYNHFYRDENLIAEVDYELVPGDNTRTELLTLRYRSYRKDYFTAALPFAQKGAAVNLPLSQVADVPVFLADPTDDRVVNATPTTFNVASNAADGGIFEIPAGTLFAQTSLLEAEAATINDLRRAFRLQEWLERNARAGTRPNEIIKSHFGVDVGDARLQLPEFIVGTSVPISISEVLDTAGTGGGDSVVGQMAGHGVGINTGRSGSYYCREHGFIIAIMSIMPDASYFQGLEKFWLKTTDPFEYYWPSFAHIGEQPIERRELMAYLDEDEGDETFGYIPRYAEYRYKPSRNTGDFTSTLDFWSAARFLDNTEKPLLNQAFIETRPFDASDIWAVPDSASNAVIVHTLHQVYASRLVAKRGTPVT